MRRFLVDASGVEKLCALGAMTWRFCAAPPLHSQRAAEVPLDLRQGSSMNNVFTAITCVAAALLSSCSVAPYKYPDTPPRQDLAALDSTRIVVKQEFRYSPTLTSIVFPAGEYVPVKRDAGGIYYESPRGLLILPVAGQGSLVRGGIYRRQDPAAHYQFAVYGGITTEPLHSMWGLNLNEKIECMPACQFK